MPGKPTKKRYKKRNRAGLPFMGNLALTIFVVLAALVLWSCLGAWRATRKEAKAKLQSLREKYADGYKSERVSFLQHEDHQILLLDLTYCATEEAVESMQRYRDLISIQPRNSLELGRLLHLEGRKRADMIDWIERKVGQPPSVQWRVLGQLKVEPLQSKKSQATPLLYSPLDHISVALMLMTVAGSNWEGIRDGWLYPAMQNLVAAMKGSRSPFEKLVKVIAQVVTPG